MTRTFTLDQIEDAMAEYAGYCRECGAEAHGIEPDARHYTCEDCGADDGVGAEELLIMGDDE